MGKIFSRIISLLQGSKPCRILMIGLDAAGKTTILNTLKLGEVVSTNPTIGFNVETVNYKNISFTVWDMGGQDRIRPMWSNYFKNTEAIIYVVDRSDGERMAEARQELEMVLESVSGKVPLLVMANKSDLPTAMSVTQVTEGLNLNSHSPRPWFVQSTCALRSASIYGGLDWLAKEVSK